MAIIGSGIENVRAFEMPAGICADGRSIEMPRLALVRWRSCWTDKFYQVYVNGRFAGVTVTSDQRQMMVQMPASLESPVRIEVFAAGADEADSDFGGQIDLPICQSARVRTSFLRSQNLPIGSTIQIYWDNGSGEIDYGNPLTDRPIRVWPAWQDKTGLGMSKFGIGDFGYDSAAAVGFGKGNFGQGQFGLDAEAIEWTSCPMRSGVYKFAMKVFDEAGNQSSSSETRQITVTAPARPAEHAAVSSFDKQTNKLILSVS